MTEKTCTRCGKVHRPEPDAMVGNKNDQFVLLNTTLPSVTEQLEEVTADSAAVIGMVARLMERLYGRGLLNDDDRIYIWDLDAPDTPDVRDAPRYEVES